ncbi:MAG: aminotransferase class I/II-fold pyridoxal phosphate-dependent enzyme [bacterium]
MSEIISYQPPIENRKGKICLDFNENNYGPSRNVIETIRNINKKEIICYPDYLDLLKKIEKMTGYFPIITNGSDDAIRIIYDAFFPFPKNSEVIIPEPTFSMFKVYASMKGVNVKSPYYIKKYSDKNLSFVYPIEKVLGCINNKTKLIIIVSPNNPTGDEIKKEDLKKILDTGKMVILDEAYYPFGKSNIDFIKNYSNIIILRTFSKLYGLAGLRIGYILTQEKNVNKLKLFQSPYSVNSIGTKAALICLNENVYYRECFNRIIDNKRYLVKKLRELNILVVDTKTNFVLVKMNFNLYKYLLKNGILIRKYEDFYRISIGTKNEIEKVINLILKIPILLFDMDGVLANVKCSYRKAIIYTVNEMSNLKINNSDIDKIKSLKGFNNDWKTCQEILKRKGYNFSINSIRKVFQKYYFKFRNSESMIISKKKLIELSAYFRMGIVTGRPKNEAFYFVNKMNIKKYFEVIITKNDIGENDKPYPCGIIKALDYFNLNIGKIRSDCYYIGDTINDEIAAKNAGIKYVDITNFSSFFSLLGSKLGGINE